MNPTDTGWNYLHQQLSNNMVSGESSVAITKLKPKRPSLAEQIRNGTLKVKKNEN